MIRSELGLPSADVAGLQECLRTLLSPFDHPTVDDWRRAVNRGLQELLGADKSSFSLPPDNGEAEYFSEQIDYHALRPSYPEWLAICEPHFHTIERAVALGAWSRRTLYLPYWSSFRRSAYYNDFVVPLRAYDSVGVYVRAGRGGGVACLLFHHERPAGMRFGRRGVALVRLVLPVFKSAVRTCLHLREYRADLNAALDGLSEGILLADANGRTLHQNPALVQLLALDPERDRLRMAIAEVVGALARFAGLPASSAPGVLAHPVARAVETTAASYRVRATYLASSLEGAGTVVLVTVERANGTCVPSSLLRERFHLTERECQVAQLLVMGRSDAAIASTLGISIHTARHHAENVRLKLGVRSREAVEQAVRRPARSPSPDCGPNGASH